MKDYFRRASAMRLDRDADDPADKRLENRQARRRAEREFRRLWGRGVWDWTYLWGRR